jgi:hypothetical protein
MSQVKHTHERLEILDFGEGPETTEFTLPLHYIKGEAIEVNDSEGNIAVLVVKRVGSDVRDSFRLARLIAASSDLLEALAAIEDKAGEEFTVPPTEVDWQEFIDGIAAIARAAIAKAGGA